MSIPEDKRDLIRLSVLVTNTGVNRALVERAAESLVRQFAPAEGTALVRVALEHNEMLLAPNEKFLQERAEKTEMKDSVSSVPSCSAS